MKNLKSKLSRFFYGRYGVDDLGRFLFLLYVVLAILASLLSFFIKPVIIKIINILLTLFAIYIFWRMMSRSIYKRMNENRRFLSIKAKTVGWFQLQKSKFRDRKTHIYRKCPKCKSTLRLKRISGKHTAVCPKCLNRFDVKV